MNLISEKLLEYDRNLSEYFAKIGSNENGRKLKIDKICQILEWIMHGIPWIFGKKFSSCYIFKSSFYKIVRVYILKRQCDKFHDRLFKNIIV